MRQQYHFRSSPKGLLSWDVERLIKLSAALPHQRVDLQLLSELDETYWYDLGGAGPTCRNIAEHALLINNTDLEYPIILCADGRVMDGMHRICRSLMQGKTHIKAVRFTTTPAPDHIGVAADDLSY